MQLFDDRAPLAQKGALRIGPILRDGGPDGF